MWNAAAALSIDADGRASSSSLSNFSRGGHSAGVYGRVSSSAILNWGTAETAKLKGSAQYTVLAVVLDDTGRGAIRSVIDSDTTAGAGRLFQFRMNASDQVQFLAANTAPTFTTVTSSIATPTDTPFVMAGRVSPAQEVSAWFNGRKSATGTIAGTPQVINNGTAQLSLFRLTGSATQPFLGGVFFAAYLPLALSDAELSSLQSPADVYSMIYEQDTIPIYWPAGGGGGFQAAWARNANTVLVGGRLAA